MYIAHSYTSSVTYDERNVIIRRMIRCLGDIWSREPQGGRAACGKPSRRTYHNKEWAAKMLEVGVTPSSTGEPGGNMTGQKMSDYPTPGGAFLKALDNLPHAFKLPFISTEGLAKAETAGGSSEPKPKNKVKYSCHQCKTNVWGKPEINIICGDCEVRFESEG